MDLVDVVDVIEVGIFGIFGHGVSNFADDVL